jgi:hypothetical protein
MTFKRESSHLFEKLRDIITSTMPPYLDAFKAASRTRNNTSNSYYYRSSKRAY